MNNEIDTYIIDDEIIYNHIRIRFRFFKSKKRL